MIKERSVPNIIIAIFFLKIYFLFIAKKTATKKPIPVKSPMENIGLIKRAKIISDINAEKYFLGFLFIKL